jgi:predicted permease
MSDLIQLSREIRQDARHTLRLWARRPWHAGFAILALAIGIGANTGVFSVVNALLLRSLPFQDPARLVSLSWFLEPYGSAGQFHAWREKSAYLADAAVVEQKDVNLGGPHEALRAHASQTSWNFFSLLGTRPVIGRGFATGEDVPGRDAVAVIGYGLWQDLYAGDQRALGSTIRLDGHPLTIVGVAPPGFDYPEHTALWKPGGFSPGNFGWATIARLKPNVTWTQASQAFAAEADRFWPKRTAAERIQYPSIMSGLRDQLAGPSKDASLVLMASVVLILLIACTNVANLLMARTADRATELSIRSAIGASRARLARQLLTESLLLSLAASIAGLFVALWTTSVAAKLQPAPLATQAYSILDVRVLCFAIAASIVSGLLFGLLPSLYAGRVHTFGARGSSTNSRGARLVRESLVAAQVMLTVVLLAGASSVGRAFIHMTQIDRGFNPAGVVTVSISLDGTTHEPAAQSFAYFQQTLARVRQLPGVQSASLTDFLPLDAKGFVGGPYGIDGRRAAHNSMRVSVLSDYFRSMGGRILAGREFTDAEIGGNASVAVINEALASEFGAPADAVGRDLSSGDTHRKIIGVVRGMDYMVDGANGYQVFVPMHSSGGFASTFVARVDGRAEDRLAMIRDAIRTVDPQVPVFGVKTMEQRLDDALARPQFYRTAVLCFAAFALLLAIIGIYGIVSYTVAQRNQEMGIRMALGTTPARLRSKLLTQGLITIVCGAIPGIAVSALSGHLLASLVDGAKSVDVVTYASTVVFLCGVAATGIWAATRPIARLGVAEILRSE